MSVARVLDLPYPDKKFESHEDAWEYCKKLRNRLQEGQSERIEDFDQLKLDNVGWEDVRAYGTDVNARQDGLANAISKISTTEKTLRISNQQDVTADATVPSTMTLKFMQGGSLNISSTKTVTINGHVDAGLFQIFEGSGSVSFGASSVKEVLPEWWGIDGTADQVQFQAANDALSVGGGIFASGAYSFSAAFEPSSNIHLFGRGKASTITSTGNIFIIEVSGGSTYPADNRGILIEKLALYGSGTPSAGGGIYVINAHECCFQNLWIGDYTTEQLFHGIHIAGGSGTDTDNLIIRDNIITATIDTSIYVYPASLGSAEELVISGNVITSAGRNGISIYGQKNSVTGNTIEESSWHGITLAAAQLCTVTGNTVCESTRTGIEIASASLDNTIVGNIVKDNDLANSSTYSGIRCVDNSLRNIIASNICMDNDKYEIYLESGSNYNSVIGNHVYGTDHDGTIIDSGTDNYVFFNEDGTGSPLYAAGVSFRDIVNTDSSDDYNGEVNNAGKYAYPKNVNTYMIFPIHFPVQIVGKSVIIEEFTIYYNTQANGDYITVAEVRQSDGDGTETSVLNHTADMGNGTSGNESHDIVDSPATLDTGKPIYFFIQAAGSDTNTDIRFYSAVIKYRADVD